MLYLCPVSPSPSQFPDNSICRFCSRRYSAEQYSLQPASLPSRLVLSSWQLRRLPDGIFFLCLLRPTLIRTSALPTSACCVLCSALSLPRSYTISTSYLYRFEFPALLGGGHFSHSVGRTLREKLFLKTRFIIYRARLVKSTARPTTTAKPVNASTRLCMVSERLR